MGKPYQLNYSSLLKPWNSNDKEGYFCSELIADLYKEMGVIHSTRISHYYFPSTFLGNTLNFINDWYLDSE